MKKVLVVVLAVVILLAATAAIWQSVTLVSSLVETAVYHVEFYGYTRDELMSGVEFPWPVFSWNLSSIQAFPVVLFIPDETGEGCADDITFTLRADYGSWMNYEHAGMNFYNDSMPEYLGSTITLPNGGGIYWDDVVLDAETGEYQYGTWFDQGNDEMFIDCIIYQDSHIIGFFVMKFTVYYSEYEGEAWRNHAFETSMAACASFPKVDGKYQDISLECIESIIAHTKSAS